MKNYLKTGLLALTIAFGIVSCDKNGLDDIEASDVGVVVNDEYSKVTFGENGAGIVIPKLKGSTESAAKSAGEFTHIYASTTSQTLSIFNDAEVEVYSGSYPANMISSINPASIILANADGYSAVSSNEANGSTDVVLDFLPYTSEVDFNLSASTRIALEATLERGFLIVNAEAEAADGNRVIGATANGEALIGPDDEGDFYGYLLGGDHAIVVTYALNGVSTDIPATQRVDLGTAYTINVDFGVENPAVVGSDVSTSTGTGLESEIGQTEGGRDINLDGDKLDSLERVVTSTQATLDTVPQGDPVLTYGSWSVVSDKDINISSDVEESTEALYGSSVNDDTDLFDTISRDVTTTQVVVNEIEISSDDVFGDWTILLDYSSVFIDENNDGINDADQVGEDATDTYSYSEWLPATAGAEFATVDQTRVATFNLMGNLDEPAVVAEDVTRTIANTAYVADEVDTYTEATTSVPSGGVATTVDNGIADITFHYGDSSYTSLALAQAAADADTSVAGTSVNIIERSTQAKTINTTAVISTATTIYTIMINVREDETPLAPKANLVVPTETTASSSVDGVAVVSDVDVSYDVAAATSEDVDVSLSQSDFTEAISGDDITWTGSGDAAGKSFGIGAGLSNNTYFYILDGSNSAEFSGSDDDAAYYAAVDAAIAAIQAQING